MIEVPHSGKILLYGPALVNVESSPVEPYEYGQLPALREYMVGMLRRSNGIGLAAPQVGVFKQFVLIQREDGTIMDMVNPEITRMVGKEIIGFESCMSVPPNGNGCNVPRMETVNVEYTSADFPGLLQESVLNNRDAAVAQHELDHLTGTFYFDRVGRIVKARVLEDFMKWKSENIHKTTINKGLQAIA